MKELKDVIRGTDYHVATIGVESGEGIERDSGKTVCRDRGAHVESGEGIESYLGRVVGIDPHLVWNPVKELKVFSRATMRMKRLVCGIR